MKEHTMEAKEVAEPSVQRSYMEYQAADHLLFDPLKDLNLPASYDEVVERYRRLRCEQPSPGLN
ncbi:MAG: hypothetical protein JSS84_15665 [Bacteroidetes bacterium]|nr:hypothetical protein [Bacteroidota bacterium]